MVYLSPQCMSQSVGPGNQLVTTLIQALLAAHCAISPPELWPKDYGPTAWAEGLEPYDFIIVGAGTAGSVVANRLSANPKWKVLLLEAGDNPPIESEIPLYYKSLRNSPVDWNFQAEHDPTSGLSMKNGSRIPRGKLLGGNSGFDNMIYIRGNPDDFNFWKDCGNPTWSWDDVLPYFKKSEQNRVGPIAANKKYHNTNGPVPIDLFRSNDLARIIFTDSAYELGIEEVIDINADKHIGLVQAEGTIDRRTRSSTAKSFLIPIKDRKNLDIIRNAKVQTLKFGKDGSVTGVKFTIKDRIIYAVARNEVVLSAGPINTPYILMLSGIGPAKYLKRRGIKVRIDLPVGRNFHDHLTVPYIFKVPRSQEQNDFMSNLVNSGYSYFIQREGQLGTISVEDLYTFLNTQNYTELYPNIQLTYSYYRVKHPELFEILTSYGYQDDIVDEICRANLQFDIGIIFVSLLTPSSRGVVGLRTNPLDPPRIKPNYLGELNDLRILSEGLEIARSLLTTQTAAMHHARELLLTIPGCSEYTYRTPLYWDCYIRHMSMSGRQPVGTTKMGPTCDEESVVDWRLRIYNVERLRVISSSIIPRIVRAPTLATTMMIAEKGADFIIEDWINRKSDGIMEY